MARLVRSRRAYFGGCKPLKTSVQDLGLPWVFIRSTGHKYVIGDSAFKRMQVDARSGPQLQEE
jgi:hypothetical protein